MYGQYIEVFITEPHKNVEYGLVSVALVGFQNKRFEVGGGTIRLKEWAMVTAQNLHELTGWAVYVNGQLEKEPFD